MSPRVVWIGAALAAIAAAQPAPPPNYVYEIWWEVYTNKGAALTRYLTRLREADLKTASGRRRFADIHPWSNRRIVSAPLVELGDYDRRLESATVFRQAFGDEEYRQYAAALAEAQISRTSYLRKYRDDLSLHRDRHTRDGIRATAYSFVTVWPWKEPQFEQLWRRALAAYRKVAPEMVLTVAETLAGGGAQYVVARPLTSYAQFETDLTPEQAVEKAFGAAELEKFNRLVSETVRKWETFLFDKGNFDTNVR